MGEVLTTMKIMPDSPEVDLEAIKAAIESSMPEGAKIHEFRRTNRFWFSCCYFKFHH